VSAAKRRVLVIGTLDTKGEEFAFLRDEIRRRGCEVLVMDLGIMGTPLFAGDITREQVIERAGYGLEQLRGGTRRAEAIDAVIAGGRAMTRELFERGEVEGVIAMGGGSGTTIAQAIMRDLPFGTPKVIVTTLTNVNPIVRSNDVVLVKTMVDLVGLNAITRTHIQHAAGAIAGMVQVKPEADRREKSVVITCLGVTTPGVTRIRQRLLERGRHVIVLHRRTHAMDVLLDSGVVEAVVDVTPSEITEEIVYPGSSDDSARLERVRDSGIPVVVSAGALDMLIHLQPADTRPPELADRPHVVHSPTATLIRTTVEEQRRLGSVLGRQLRRARGPAAAVIPMKGFSMWDASGGPFEQPEARAAFADALEDGARGVRVERVDAHLNDDEFADAIVGVLLELTDRRKRNEE